MAIFWRADSMKPFSIKSATEFEVVRNKREGEQGESEMGQSPASTRRGLRVPARFRLGAYP
jgi:hypothetical protein